MPLILAEEIDSLTVQDIQQWDRRAGDGGGIFIDVIDKRNLTDERLERLKSLVLERDKSSEPCAVDADKLNAKLQEISTRASSPPSDAPSTPVTAGAELTWDERIAEMRHDVYKNHQELKDVGGRPSREINPDPGPCPPSDSERDKQYHVSDHWYNEWKWTRSELQRWLDFRWHQFKMREDLKTFNKYTDVIHKYKQEKGFDWAVELQLDRQTKLDEWCEYYIYEHRKRPALEKELDRAERELEPAKERMRRATLNGSVGIPETVLLKRAAEMVKYRKTLSRAQKEAEMAHKRLEVLKVKESLSAGERDLLIVQAEEELQSAQRNLEAEKSDELEQLRKEAERKKAQSSLERSQGKVNLCNMRLEQLDTLLGWISGQFAGIGMGCVPFGRGSQYHCDLLEGWEKYYVYMRERLQVEQDRDAEFLQMGWTREKTEAEEARDDLLFPQERVRPLRVLLTWVEREFPELAAKYGPFGKDRKSSGNRQDPDLAFLPCSGSSPSGPALKASPLGVVRKSARRKGKSDREGSPVAQVQASKVSKPSQGRRRPLNRKRGDARNGLWPSEDSVNDAGQIEEQGSRKAAVYRSGRIPQRTLDPSPHPRILGRATKPTVRRCTDGIVRRSERIRSQISDQDIQPSQSSTTGSRKSARLTGVHKDAISSRKPQGISKRRCRKGKSKNGKSVVPFS